MATKSDARTQAGSAEEGEERSAAAAKKSRFSFKRILLLGAALVLVGGAGGGAYYFKASRGRPPIVKQAKPVVFYDMPDVLVNLSTVGGNARTQYLKVKVTLELPDKAMKAQIQPVMPRLLDTFQTYLRELRPSDLDGSAGLYRLKEELTRRVNLAIAPNRINAVLFKEIVVQ